MPAIITTAKFIEKARVVHGDTYDYSKVEYVAAIVNVRIICKIHGEFHQTANNHLNGCGCPKCGRNSHLSNESFIEKAKAIHGDTYDYSKVEYIGRETKVQIICRIHGEFPQRAADHMHGSGCPKCSHAKSPQTTDDFIEKAKAKHGDTYDYSKVNYVLNKLKVQIICRIHGEFPQQAQHHLNGSGCPKCSHDRQRKNRSSPSAVG